MGSRRAAVASLVLLVTLLLVDVPGASAGCGPSWNIVTSPDSADPYTSIRAMDGLSPSDVWIAGEHETGAFGTILPYAAHWNGSSWSAASFATQGTGDNELNGVKELSSTDAWIVGDYTGVAGFVPIAAHWNGAVWIQTAPPAPGAKGNFLSGVDATGDADVWAVGGLNNAQDVRMPLVEHYTQTGWHVVAAPKLHSATLEAVTAVSAKDVWAVGNQYTKSGQVTLVLHYDGRSWTRVPSANPGTGSDFFNGVDSAGSRFVVATGSYSVRKKVLPLLERWSPSSGKWVRMKTGSAPTKSYMTDIDATSASDAWSVGWSGPQAVALHWNGSAWKTSAPAIPGGATATALRAIEMFSGVAWAAGGWGDTTNGYTLLEEHC